LRGPTPRRILHYVRHCLRLKAYLKHPGDGRPRAQIAAEHLLWSLLIGYLLRESSFHAVEALVCSKARRSLGVGRNFGDDALAYFTERLDPEPTRRALADALSQAKRNKAFDNTRFIGVAVDGTTVARCSAEGCSLCRPFRDSDGEIGGYRHHVVMGSIVGTGLSLPVDVEPYGPGDSEYAAGQRLLQRIVAQLGSRFAQYVVVDGGFATAPFLHTADEVGLKVIARLKSNLPELLHAAEARFGHQRPGHTFKNGTDRIEIWDADDFDPWDALHWKTVRVIRYRQHRPDGTIIEAYWLTNFSTRQVGSESLYRMAKSRWEVENQGFNDAKNRYGLEHITHHDANSLLVCWLLLLLALTIERLYRLRYLHRGTHIPHSAIDLLRLLRLSLAATAPSNTS
jgi:Transposase DDE domain